MGFISDPTLGWSLGFTYKIEKKKNTRNPKTLGKEILVKS
jgi:hypothetical protein